MPERNHAAAVLGLCAGADRADEYVDQAKACIAKITAPGAPWIGSTTGPKAQGTRTVVFVNYYHRNGDMAPGVGLEPTTERLTAACSTN